MVISSTTISTSSASVSSPGQFIPCTTTTTVTSTTTSSSSTLTGNISTSVTTIGGVSGGGTSGNCSDVVVDVVFVIEATAHISPYVESLKTNYIIPTIEYFNGINGGCNDDRFGDFGGHLNYSSSTIYGLVTFMSMDCRPDSASFCYAPTSNSNTFLQYLEKIQFIGGAGDSSSHIAEGLCTAISLFDDCQNLRDKCLKEQFKYDSNGGGGGGVDGGQQSPAPVNSKKYLILICNSTPYMEPVYESPVYCGYTIDELMNIMIEKGIHFSVFSPRKMKFLYKLFENGGGKLSTALTKNYAKDRRHLVLLNGFQLQEKDISPMSQPLPSQPAVIEQQQQQDKCQPQQQISQGIKRPLSPSTHQPVSASQPPHSALLGPQQSQPSMLTNPNQLMSLNRPQIEQQNVQQQQSNNLVQQFGQQQQPQQQPQQQQQLGIRQVGSPSIGHWNNGAAKQVPSPVSQMSVRTQLPQSVRQRVPTPQPTTANQISMNQQQQTSQQTQLPGLVPQQHQNVRPMNVQQQQQSQTMVRPVSNNGNMRPQPSPFSQAVPSPSQPQQSPMMRGTAVMSPMNPVQSPMSQSQPSQQQQQFIQQQSQMNQMSHLHPQQQQQQPGQQQMQQQQVTMNTAVSQGQMMNIPGTMSTMMSQNHQRTRIWNGVIEYTDKAQSLANPQSKISYPLECQITYQPNNNEPEFKADKWPEKLILCTVPKTLMNRLSPIFKNNSYQVHFHFPNESQGLQLLCKAMGSMVGCIQLTTPANIRIIIVFYLPDKKLFLGFIPHDQEEFMNSMKQLVETHKKEQNVKQKMIMQMQQQHQQQQNSNNSGGGPSTLMSNQQIQQPSNQQLVHQMNTGPNGNQIVQIIHQQGQHHQQQQQQQQPTTMIQTGNNSNNQMFQVQIPSMNNQLQQQQQQQPQQQQMTSMASNILPSNVQMMNTQSTMANVNKNFQMANPNVTMVTTSTGCIPVSINSFVQVQSGPSNIQQAQQQQQQQFQINQQQQQSNPMNTGTATMVTIQQQQQQPNNNNNNQNIQQAIQQQQQSQNVAGVRHHLQQQIQQKQQQHIQLQQLQHQAGNINLQQQQQHMNNNNNNVPVSAVATPATQTQLRYLLQQQHQQQQQQMRTMNPATQQRLNIQTQQNLQPQQQQQIMLQQQQLRFQQQQQQQQTIPQNSIQIQNQQVVPQQQQQQTNSQQQQQQQAGNYFGDQLY
ncbi:uncharacterized protein LOC113798707 [Dermatophagoides pteronyssinus]|uniref:uncharacterized protein LOC113798707 n=1 Tax=Dermatophagoides pteronyssinus TaxID=6956 RepID=UPI003F67E9FB